MGNYQYNGGGNNGRKYEPYKQNNNFNKQQAQFAGGKKHSGSKTGFSADKSPYITGWNYSKQRGMISMIAGPYKGTKDHKSEQSGRTWQNWFCKITYKATGVILKTTGLYEPATGKMLVKELGMIANPRAPRGGYFGKFSY